MQPRVEREASAQEQALITRAWHQCNLRGRAVGPPPGAGPAPAERIPSATKERLMFDYIAYVWPGVGPGRRDGPDGSLFRTLALLAVLAARGLALL